MNKNVLAKEKVYKKKILYVGGQAIYLLGKLLTAVSSVYCLFSLLWKVSFVVFK